MGMSSSSFKTIKRRADKNVLIGQPIKIPVVQYHSVNQGNKLICFIYWSKLGCVFPRVIWPKFRMWQCREIKFRMIIGKTHPLYSKKTRQFYFRNWFSISSFKSGMPKRPFFLAPYWVLTFCMEYEEYGVQRPSYPEREIWAIFCKANILKVYQRKRKHVCHLGTHF